MQSSSIPLRSAAVAVVCLIMGGSAVFGETILATVGDRPISMADLRSFEIEVGKSVSPDLAPTQRDSVLLRALIDRTVLNTEAEQSGIADEEWFALKVQASVEAGAVQRYKTQKINMEVSVTSEEMHEHFKNTHRDRALRYAGILVDTEEEALEVSKQLEEGADFAEVAKHHSLFQKTRGHGGDMGIYLLKDETDPPIQPIFELAVGALSEPVAAPFDGVMKYAIFKVLAELPVGLESARDAVSDELFGQKRDAREKVVLDSLLDDYGVQVQEANLKAVTERFPQGMTPELATIALCTYRDGGEITVAEYQAILTKNDGSVFDMTDVVRIRGLLHRTVISTALYLEAARTLNLHADDRAQHRRQRIRRDLLVTTLKEREVDERVPLPSAEDAERFYREHPEKFQTWATLIVNEILVSDEDNAKKMRRQLDQGADAAQLAAKQTVREGFSHHEGRLTLNKGTQFRYGEALYEAARQLDAGQVGGPVKLESGYSVFKVLTHTRSQLKPYNETSQTRAAAYVRIDRLRRVFVEYVQGLWKKHDVQVLVDYL